MKPRIKISLFFAVSFLLAAVSSFAGAELKNVDYVFTENNIVTKGNADLEIVEYNGEKYVKIAEGADYLVRGVSKSVFKSSFTASDEIAEQAWVFFKNEDWEGLENLFNTNNINKHNGLVFPPNNGAVNITKKTLDPADFNNNLIIDRYGTATGKYTAPANTPFNQRSLPSSYANQTPQKYRVIKPIPNVEEGQVIPWFNQPGLGIQYKLEKSVQWYIDHNYLEIIN